MALRDPQIPLPGGPDSPPPEREAPAAPERALPVSWALLALCVGWYAIGAALELSGRPDALPWLGLFGPLVRAGEYWRAISTVFEHANVIHLVFNMSAVWTLGRVLEYGVGSFRFFITTLVGALGSAVFVLLFNFEQRTVGASGAILAWGGAILPIATRHGRSSIGTWLFQVAIISLLPGVSWAGHLGGFLFGLPCGWAIRGGPGRFAVAAPILVFVSAILVLLAGRQ